MSNFLNDFCSIGLSFKYDSFRLLYFGVSLLVFILCSVFATDHLKGKKKNTRFVISWIVTFLCTVGLLFSGDFFTLFMFFEIMSLASTIWVFQAETPESDYAGRVYLRISVLCGLVMLYGIFLVFVTFGTLDLEKLTKTSQGAPLSLKLLPCILISIGFAAKAGAFVFHVWLPRAYTEAVAPGTAFLSAILSKAGIIGMILTSSALGLLRSEVWGNILLVFGACTMVTGAVLAIFNRHLKRTIACSSLSQIGFILTGLACMVLEPDGIAYTGTVLHMLNHTFIKTALFILAGSVYSATGTYDLNELKGCGRKNYISMGIFAVCAASLAGIPGFSGFVSKNMMHEALDAIAEESSLAAFVSVVFTLTGGLTLCYMLKLFICLFVEKKAATGNVIYDEKKGMGSNLIMALIPAVIVFVSGFWTLFKKLPSLAVLEEYDTSAKYPDFTEAVSLKLFTPGVLLTTFISLAVGTGAYFLFVRVMMIRKEGTETSYKTGLPAWVDLERYVYRPVFMYFLPFVLAFTARLFDKITDLIIYFFRKKIFKPLKRRKPVAGGNTFSYALGTALDRIFGRRRKPGKVSYVTSLALFNEQTAAIARMIERSLSLSMLLFSTGLVITFIYMLFK